MTPSNCKEKIKKFPDEKYNEVFFDSNNFAVYCFVFLVMNIIGIGIYYIYKKSMQ